MAIINTGYYVGLRGQDADPGCQDMGPGDQDVSPGGQDLGFMRLGCGTQEPEFMSQNQSSGFPRPRSWSQWLGSGSQRPKSRSQKPESRSQKTESSSK